MSRATFDKTGRWLLVISLMILAAQHLFLTAVIAFFIIIALGSASNKRNH